MAHPLTALSQEWNDAGRQFARGVQARLDRFHRGEVADAELPADPRGEGLAARVLGAVVELNQVGRWREARRWFEPAHEPFIPMMGNEGLPFVVALGEDEALFRRGSSHQEGHLWHVTGSCLTPLPGLLAAAVSPDRGMLALAEAGGVRVLKGWNGAEVARLPWPSGKDMVPRWVPASARDRYDVESPASSLVCLCVANSGLRIAVACESGVLVGDARDGLVRWHLALPRHDEPDDGELGELKKGRRARFHGDMVHAALSGDGKFLACGAQDDGHYLFAVDRDGATRLWAKLGHASEYPHDACFSSDGTQVAFNSCHFYSGATIVADTQAIKGAVTEPGEEDPRAPGCRGSSAVPFLCPLR